MEDEEEEEEESEEEEEDAEEEAEEQEVRREEGAKALADGGESLRRVARRSYRRYHGGSARSPPRFPPRPRSPVTPRRIHLRNNTWYTVSRSPAYPGYAIHYTVRRNNVTLAPW